MDFLDVFWLGIACTVVGIIIAIGYGRVRKDFSWDKYLLFMLGPVTSVGLWVYLYDVRVAYLFFAGSLVGLTLEFLIGWVYQLVFQRKLWEYDRKAYALGGHTSLLTIPMWGTAAVIFWIVAKFVGL